MESGRIQLVDAAGRCLKEAALHEGRTGRALRKLAAAYLCRALGLELSEICPLRA